MVTPAAVIGYSPLLKPGAREARPDYMRRDAYLPMSQVEALKDRWAGGPEPIAGPIRPSRADPRVYPPVFFSVAQYELMRPDVEAMTGSSRTSDRPSRRTCGVARSTPTR